MTLDETLAATSVDGLVDAIIRLTHRIRDTPSTRDAQRIDQNAELRRQRDVVKAELVGRTLAPVSAGAEVVHYVNVPEPAFPPCEVDVGIVTTVRRDVTCSVCRGWLKREWLEADR